MTSNTLTLIRILLKLFAIALLIIILIFFSSADVDFIYTGF